jgi:hypothetical protein
MHWLLLGSAQHAVMHSLLLYLPGTLDNFSGLIVVHFQASAAQYVYLQFVTASCLVSAQSKAMKCSYYICAGVKYTIRVAMRKLLSPCNYKHMRLNPNTCGSCCHGAHIEEDNGIESFVLLKDTMIDGIHCDWYKSRFCLCNE